MKTTIEWLYNELSKNNISTDSVIERINKESSIWKQAKQMEKDQIEIAFDLGRDEVTSIFLIDGEDYYNKSYNQNK
jgi:hypothetical protein